MKKVIGLILISALLIVFSANVYAEGVLGNEGTTTITGNEYKNAQQNTKNTAKNNSTTLPQTGAGDFGLGIIIIACVGSAVFACKKISDYKGI